MIIDAISKTLYNDLLVIFPIDEWFGGSYQLRKGRYVINTHMIIEECLVLDDDDNIIDGFSMMPILELPWKDEPFIEHLKRLHNIKFLEGYDD